MKKIIVTSLLVIILTSACEKNKPFEKTLTIDEQIIETDTIDTNDNEQFVSEIVIPKSNETKKETNKLESHEEKIDKPQYVIESSIDKENSIDEVDEESIDYNIHKGRIDCKNEAECMNKSIPIQFKYKKSIANVYYLEVISKNNNILGYFIEYIFKENKYDTYEECNNIGIEIQDILSDRVESFECTGNGILKISTDYRKE